MKNRMIVAAVLLASGFSAGFLPQYATARRLNDELQKARQQNSMAQLRNLAALAYLRASEKSYALARRQHAFLQSYPGRCQSDTEFQRQKALSDLMSFWDEITAGSAKGDPTRQATAISASAPQSE